MLALVQIHSKTNLILYFTIKAEMINVLLILKLFKGKMSIFTKEN